MKIHTIGFTKKSAETFFTLLHNAHVKRVVDGRLNNFSQLAGFSKKEDLAFFLKELCGIEYVHLPILSPTQDIITDYRRKRGSWEAFRERYLNLITDRKREERIEPETLHGGCLLCSEDKPHHCHRTLAAEYLQEHWGDVEIDHLAER